MEQPLNEAVVLTLGFFWAHRTSPGVDEADLPSVTIHFWRSTERGTDAALADAVEQLLPSPSSSPRPELSYLNRRVGRVAVLEARSPHVVVLLYVFVDPRMSEMCAASGGGYLLMFRFPVADLTLVEARAEADVIVESAAFVDFDRTKLAPVLCPVPPTPVPLPSTFVAGYPTLGDAGANGGRPSLAIGWDGVPLFSYLYHDPASQPAPLSMLPPDSDLAVYVCSDPACRGGTARTLDEVGRTGFSSAIAIGADGNPVIRYYDVTREDLRFYACADPHCSAGSARTLVSEGNVGNTGSIAIGVDGNPIITFSKSVNYVQYLEVYVCADPTCVNGVVRDLGLTGLSSAIAIGADGNPVISYRDGETDVIGFYACGDPTCSTGRARTLDVAGTSWNTAIVIGRDGNPLIAYCDATNYDDALGVYACGDSTCSTGTARILDPRGGLLPSIAIDGDGLPVISYAASPGRGYATVLAVYACSAPDCSAGVVLMPDTASDATGGTSIRIAADGTLIIAYSDNAYPGAGLHLVVAGGFAP